MSEVCKRCFGNIKEDEGERKGRVWQGRLALLIHLHCYFHADARAVSFNHLLTVETKSLLSGPSVYPEFWFSYISP